MAEQGQYLFAVTEGLGPEALAGQDGLGASPLRLVEHAGLQAVVCDVSLTEYGEESLRRNLEDLGWVETVARTHDAVIRAVAARGTVAPMRLVTICVGDDRVVDRLREWEGPLRSALERVRGCHEWSVKAYAVPVSAPATAGSAGSAEPASGRAYLESKRRQAQQRQSAHQSAEEDAASLHGDLAGRTRAGRRLAPQDPQLSGRSEQMILNGAYLVADDEEQEFQRAVDELRRHHPDVSVEVAGPWPPYSFAVLENPQ